MYMVIGIQNVDFKAPDGNHIVGKKLYLSYDKDHVEGKACESCFIKDSISLVGVQVGDNVELTYNKYGKVSDVKLTSII